VKHIIDNDIVVWTKNTSIDLLNHGKITNLNWQKSI